DAKVGDISDRIYESEDNSKYIVAKVVDVRPEGQLPLNAVKDQITVPVRNMVKANQLITQASEAVSAGGNLEAIAQRLGTTSVLAENVTLSNPIIPAVAMEPAVVGTVFGSEVSQPSKPVEGNQGVYIVEVAGFVNPEVPADLSEQKQTMAQGHAQRVWSLMFRALTEKAEVVDNRARFF
ncbi:MAG TPA: peptidylprolyl isomerase, partial [Sphingobacteriaceae bacterium]|nr:peptidylprolyl isomerase [Sphingobacteriaceae bacterium]